nr:SH3 domain-containing protein [Gammaproteobacteria bacterium]
QGVEKNQAIALGWYISAALRQHEPARETLLELLAKNDDLAQSTILLLLQSDWSILGDTRQVNVERANIRRGPDTSYPVVTTLEKGQQVIPLREQNGWTYIGIIGEGVTAWIHSPLLSKPAGIYPKQ